MISSMPEFSASVCWSRLAEVLASDDVAGKFHKERKGVMFLTCFTRDLNYP